ncbi:MAG: oxygen-independent coproporphyrinogen III oxidase [bacterium]
MENKEYLDIEVLSKKYDETKIPLYLSYPTMTYWHNHSEENNFLKHIQEEPNPFLYFHFPYCKKACYYCACFKLVESTEEEVDIYLDYLEKEISMKANSMSSRDLSVEHMHWGGGTPTNLSLKQLERIYSIIEKHFHIVSNEKASISIESYPDFTLIDREKLTLLRDLGFTEISFGIQDFDETVQKAINRDCKFETVERLFTEARKLGLRIHVDLCYGLPFQEMAGFSDTINKILMIQPDRIAVENYAHFPLVYPLQRKIPLASIPNSFMRILLYILGRDMLLSNGYKEVGLYHFVKEDNNMYKAFIEKKINRDLMGYSVGDRRQFIGFGNSSISFIGNTYFHNKSSINEYYQWIDENKLPLEDKSSHILTDDDLIRNIIIQKEILTYLQIDKTKINNEYHVKFDDYFHTELKNLSKFEDDHVLCFEDNIIKIVGHGKYIAKHIAFVFDKYYRKE